MRASSWFCLSRALPLLIVFGLCLITTAGYGQSVPEEKLTVAILEFEDTSPKDEFARLDRALQSMLTTDLAASRDMALVERARLEDVRAELNLVKTGFLDPRTAAKVGKGVGAKAVLTGSFWVRDDMLRIDARLVHVETGTVLLAEEITGSANDFTELEKQLARKVLDAVGIRLSPIESADLSKKHTSSLVAASRYGRALYAGDTGDLDGARRNATASLEADPDFGLAKSLLNQISNLLDRSRQDDFRLKVLAIVQFEDSLNGHVFVRSIFKPDDYPQLLQDEGPERALFYWISYLGAGDFIGNRNTSPCDLLFTSNSLRSNQGLVSRLYLDLGGSEPVLFWCDVVTSDPKYAPSVPLTNKQLKPDWRSMPAWGPWPAHFYHRLPDVYDKRFQAQAWILADFESALQSLETAHTICKPIISEPVYRRRLESLKKIVGSSSQLARKREEARSRQQLWKLAHDQIVDYHAALQNSRFSKPNESENALKAGEVREKLAIAYADRIMVGFGGRAAQERQAKQLVDRLLDEANGSAFVARRTPVFGDEKKAALIEVMHIAGCPHSYLSRQSRVAAGLPVPTAIFPDVENGLTTSDDPQAGIKNSWVPCAHCRPFRWAGGDVVGEYMAKRLPIVIRDFIDNKSKVAKAELSYLLPAFRDHPTSKVHESLQQLCQHVCKLPLGDRKLHATALQAMAKIATPDDAIWLIALLDSTPWWDVRINVAATLATVENDQIFQALEKARDREAYYFVKHSLEAALTRARERNIRSNK